MSLRPAHAGPSNLYPLLGLGLRTKHLNEPRSVPPNSEPLLSNLHQLSHTLARKPIADFYNIQPT